MAGVGFVLRKLSRRDDLAGALMGYFYAAVIACGPWIFTIMSLGVLVFIGNQFLIVKDLSEFRIIIIYNFAFSLVFSAPIFMVATRFLSDAIYQKDVSGASGLLLGTLVLSICLAFPLVMVFYFYYAELAFWVKAAAVLNYFLITGIWQVSIFMSALKEYAAIARTFGIGMAIAAVAAIIFASGFTVSGMLMGFNIGLAYIFFDLAARVLAEFPGFPRKPFAFCKYFISHWEIAASGLLYNLGVWVDKWIMWFAPEGIKQSNGLISYPHYDGAMFLAYLTIVPAIALFTFSVETGFFEQYLRYYQDIQNHAIYDRIKKNADRLWKTLLSSASNIVILQLTIGLVAVFIAPLLIVWVQGSPMQLGIFRLGVLGAIFHAFTMFLIIVLSYFDVRKKSDGGVLHFFYL